jgi:hypothetical protein
MVTLPLYEQDLAMERVRTNRREGSSTRDPVCRIPRHHAPNSRSPLISGYAYSHHVELYELTGTPSHCSRSGYRNSQAKTMSGISPVNGEYLVNRKARLDLHNALLSVFTLSPYPNLRHCASCESVEIHPFLHPWLPWNAAKKEVTRRVASTPLDRVAFTANPLRFGLRCPC